MPKRALAPETIRTSEKLPTRGELRQAGVDPAVEAQEVKPKMRWRYTRNVDPESKMTTFILPTEAGGSMTLRLGGTYVLCDEDARAALEYVHLEPAGRA
jgi:hypothetical protein